ncbi:uncharacterized protein LOC105191902 isoform X1 [Harpegnathos saltator]|nr:uncharacterized protein LOC105191902 isoform X1 [Harpegnathos saltator]
MVSTCLLCKTGGLNKDISSHAFPKDPERYLLWFKAINKLVVSKSATLCSKHLEERFYRYSIVECKRFLTPTAVPTLYLYNHKENAIKGCQNIEESLSHELYQHQDLVHNNVGCVNIEERSSLNELHQNQDPVHNNVRDAQVQSDPERHTDVPRKRMRYRGDVDWNKVSQIPSEAKYYGMLAAQEVKTLRKELNVRD